MTEHPARLLEGLEQRARKRFGQHFLASEGTARAIVRAAEIGPGSRVLEIGPGLGMLTGCLVDAGAEVVAVELDRDLAPFLAERHPTVRVVHADATKVDWPDLLPGPGWRCVANLPYNVGTGLVLELIRHPGTFDRLVVMLQKEVAERLVARPGNRARGSLSVAAQARADLRIVLRVPPGAFHPPPKVESAVIEARLLPTPRVADPDRLERVVRAAFAAPRKMLRRSLADAFGPTAAEALSVAGIDGTARPSELDIDAWEALAGALPG